MTQSLSTYWPSAGLPERAGDRQVNAHFAKDVNTMLYMRPQVTQAPRYMNYA